MSRKIILHIGRHKCGTTAIQRALHGNRERLSQLGFFYPQPGTGEIAHHRVGNALARKPFLSSFRSIRTPATHNRREPLNESELHAFRQILSGAAQEWAVLSSESFQNCRPVKIRRFFQGFEVYPVCYIREQGAYLRSSYAQRVQASHYGGSVEAYYRSWFHADYRKFLNKWARNFGERLIVRRFERDKLHRGDVVEDFLSEVLGLGDRQYQQLVLPGNENPSLSSTMLAFKLRLNREGYQMTPKIYPLLVKLDTPGASPYQLSANFLARVRKKYNRSNRAVARRYFQGEELFTIHTAEQAAPLPDLEDNEFQALLQRFEEASPGCISLRASPNP